MNDRTFIFEWTILLIATCNPALNLCRLSWWPQMEWTLLYVSKRIQALLYPWCLPFCKGAEHSFMQVRLWPVHHSTHQGLRKCWIISFIFLYRCETGYIGTRCEYLDLAYHVEERRKIVIACVVTGLVFLIVLIVFICVCTQWVMCYIINTFIVKLERVFFNLECFSLACLVSQQTI